MSIFRHPPSPVTKTTKYGDGEWPRAWRSTVGMTPGGGEVVTQAVAKSVNASA
jgi:hypothetical protein